MAESRHKYVRALRERIEMRPDSKGIATFHRDGAMTLSFHGTDLIRVADSGTVSVRLGPHSDSYVVVFLINEVIAGLGIPARMKKSGRTILLCEEEIAPDEWTVVVLPDGTTPPVAYSRTLHVMRKARGAN